MSSRVRRVVAYIDSNPCTLAGLRRAVSLAARDKALLVVAYVPPAAVCVPILWIPAPALDYAELESAVFKSAAELIAPSRASWAYCRLASAHEALAPFRLTDHRETLAVFTSHRRGHRLLLRPRSGVRRALRRLAEAPPVEVVDCTIGRGRMRSEKFHASL